MQLHYLHRGSPENPPFLFMHGLGASSDQTLSAFTDLSDSWLIAPDMPGHGHSTNFNADQFSFDNFGDRIISLMDRLEIEKIDLGGLSMGAGIALNVALRHPHRVKRLVLLRPSWLSEAQPSHLKVVADLGRWIEDNPESAWSHLEKDAVYQELKTQCLGAAHSVADMLERSQDLATTRVLYKMWESRPFENLEDLSYLIQDTLVLDTVEDPLHPQSIAQAIAERVPQAAYQTLPARYKNSIAYQTSLNAAVRDFLSHDLTHT